MDYKFEYLLAVMVITTIFKILDLVQFSQEIGPLFKIVGIMMTDFANFLGLYLVLIAMFAILACFNFMADIKGFETFFESALRVFGMSLGDYELELFEPLQPF